MHIIMQNPTTNPHNKRATNRFSLFAAIRFIYYLKRLDIIKLPSEKKAISNSHIIFFEPIFLISL